MKIGFYPGCSLEGVSREYYESVVAVCRAFEIEPVEVPDWNCCGSTAAHNLNKELSLALPTTILAQAEKAEMREIVVPCAACYSRLSVTKHELTENPQLASKIIERINLEYKGTIEILNIMQFIEKYISDKIASHIIRKFEYQAACYYGCLLVRPHKILGFDQLENPQSMDILMKQLGATPVEWAYKTECCGAGFSLSRTDTVSRLSGKILEDAVAHGADLIVVACPMCHSNLDMRRKNINQWLGRDIQIPVLYITQVIGIAIGLSEKNLGLNRHVMPVILNNQRN